MPKRKRTKSIDEVSVSKLLDDFVDLSVENDSKHTMKMNDDEYIRMMLEKEDKKKQEREKRFPPSGVHDGVQTSPDDVVEDSHLQHIEQDETIFETTCQSDLSREDEMVVDEIMKSQDLMGEPVLSGRIKASVEFMQNEVSTSESKRKARKTLEKYRKDTPSSMKKEVALVISESRAPLKRCQTCYFCIGERKVGGSCWCNCSNTARSSHAVVKGSWVKSRLNLPCWKPPQE